MSLLRTKVYFTGQGFRHLYIEGTGHPRGKKDAMMRLNLLEHAPNVVRYSKIIVRSSLTEANDSNFGKQVIYHELFCKIGITQASAIVVVRQIGKGNPHFYGIRYHKKRNKPQ